MSRKIGTSVDLDDSTAAVIVTLKNKDGDDDETLGSGTFPLAEVHSDLQTRVALYGLSKILQDRTSDSSMKDSRLDEMKEVFARLVEGQWAKAREAGGPTISAEVEALAALQGVSVADVQKSLRRYDDASKQKILNNPTVKAKAAEILASRNAEGDVDLSAFAA